jgi:argininosuccinate lyase
MKKLWEKNGQLDKSIELFETREDLALDQKLVAYDVAVNMAHAKMLHKIGLISTSELSQAR